MAYTITRTNGTNSIVIPDGTINTETTVTFVGKNYPNYGAILGQNFLRLLEHSSNGTAPSSPITGELWWDSTNKILKVWTGVAWKNVGSTTANATAPTGSHNVGDLWWDTTNGQLWAYDGNISDYKLVGPIGGTGGTAAETLTDTSGGTHDVISMSIGGSRYLILSSYPTAFTPIPAISGFQTISPGLNLANTAFLTNAKFTGMASNSLQLNGYTSDSFMRTDVNTTTTGTINITNNNGLYVGSTNSLNLAVSSPNVAIISNTNAGTMNFKVRNSSGTQLGAMDIYSNGNVVCNYDLIVTGQTKFGGSDDFAISGTTQSTNTVTGALRVAGGVGIQKNLNVGGTQSNFVGQVRAETLYSNSTITGTIATAAQASITSLGTLTGLTVVGTSNLGAVGTVKISGGSNGYVLVTDGSGNLTWSNPSSIPTDTTQLTNGAGYVTSNTLTSTLSAYVTSTGLSSTLGSYVTSTSLSSTLSSYVTSTSLSSTLSAYETTAAHNADMLNYVTRAYLDGLGFGSGDISSAEVAALLAGYVTTTTLTSTLLSYVTSSTLTSTLTNYVTATTLAGYHYLTAESSTLDAILNRGSTSSHSIGTGALTVTGTLNVTSTSTLGATTASSISAGTIGNTGATLTAGTSTLGATTAASISAGTIGNSGAVLYGTLNSSSAAQTNITSVGTLTALTVNGALSVTGGSGSISCSGDITAFASDMRLKTDIEPIANALDKVNSLTGFTYNFNDVGSSLGFSTTTRYVGVSAQEIQAVLPEAVKPAPSNPEYLTVQYEKIVPLLIEAIKELKAEVEFLKNKTG